MLAHWGVMDGPAEAARRPGRYHWQCGGAAAAGSAAPQLMAVVKSDGYGHGMIPAARAALAGGAELAGGGARRRRRSRCAARASPAAGAGADRRARRGARGGGPRRRGPVRVDSVPLLAEIAAAAAAAGQPGPGAPQGGHRDVPRRRDTGRLARAGGRRAGRAGRRNRHDHRDLVPSGLRGHPRSPVHRRPARRFTEAVGQAEAAGARPEVRHLANTAATLTLPGHLVRPGPAGRRGVRAGHPARAAPRAGSARP